MSNVKPHAGAELKDGDRNKGLVALINQPQTLLGKVRVGLPGSLQTLNSLNEPLRITILRDIKSRHCRPATWCSSCAGYTRLSGRSFLASVRVSVTPAERNLAEGKIASLEEKMSVMAGVCL